MQKQISHYNILSKLASGGMANVFLALDTNTGTNVAIKILKEEVSDKEKILERFSQEGLLNLEHPSIVKILDAGVNENTPYIVMEYVEGSDLEELIKTKGRLPLGEALSVFGQLLSALAYVHNKGIIHRDIKPKNILIDKSGKVKLTDFGIAKSLSSHVKTSTGGYLGAPAYSSPEQMDGLTVDNRSDIYSLGITLYEMLSGVTPFSSTSIPSLIKEKFSGKYRLVSSYRQDVPPYVISVISKCIAVNPKDRFGSVTEIINALNNLYGTDTFIKEPIGKTLSPAKKIAFISSSVAIVMLIIIIILAVNLTNKNTQLSKVAAAITASTPVSEIAAEEINNVADETNVPETTAEQVYEPGGEQTIVPDVYSYALKVENAKELIRGQDTFKVSDLIIIYSHKYSKGNMSIFYDPSNKNLLFLNLVDNNPELKALNILVNSSGLSGKIIDYYYDRTISKLILLTEDKNILTVSEKNIIDQISTGKTTVSAEKQPFNPEEVKIDGFIYSSIDIIKTYSLEGQELKIDGVSIPLRFDSIDKISRYSENSIYIIGKLDNIYRFIRYNFITKEIEIDIPFLKAKTSAEIIYSVVNVPQLEEKFYIFVIYDNLLMEKYTVDENITDKNKVGKIETYTLKNKKELPLDMPLFSSFLINFDILTESKIDFNIVATGQKNGKDNIYLINISPYIVPKSSETTADATSQLSKISSSTTKVTGDSQANEGTTAGTTPVTTAETTATTTAETTDGG